MPPKVQCGQLRELLVVRGLMLGSMMPIKYHPIRLVILGLGLVPGVEVCALIGMPRTLLGDPLGVVK